MEVASARELEDLLEHSKLVWEDGPLFTRQGRDVERVQSKLRINHMLLKDQSTLFSKFHFSTLLDALDLCKGNIFAILDGGLNFIQEYWQNLGHPNCEGTLINN